MGRCAAAAGESDSSDAASLIHRWRRRGASARRMGAWEQPSTTWRCCTAGAGTTGRRGSCSARRPPRTQRRMERSTQRRRTPSSRPAADQIRCSTATRNARDDFGRPHRAALSGYSKDRGTIGVTCWARLHSFVPIDRCFSSVKHMAGYDVPLSLSRSEEGNLKRGSRLWGL